MRKVVFLLPFIFSCSASVKDWGDAYRYQAPRGWDLKKEAEKILPKEAPQEEKKEQSLYNQELQKKLSELIKTEPAPLRVPDTVVRVLVLPYVDETSNLVSQKYIFFRAEEGRWILGEYLLQKGKPIRELKPLEEEKR